MKGRDLIIDFNPKKLADKSNAVVDVIDSDESDDEDKVWDLLLQKPAKINQDIEALREDEDKFESLFHDCSDITYAISLHPNYGYFIVSQMIKHQKVFDNYVKGLIDFMRLARAVPDASQSLMQFLLSHPGEFKRLVKDDNDLKSLGTYFPGHNRLFSGKHVKDVLRKLSDNMIAIQLSAYYFLKDALDENVGCMLPNDVIFRIACFAADSDVYTLDTGMKIAEKQYVRMNSK